MGTIKQLPAEDETDQTKVSASVAPEAAQAGEFEMHHLRLQRTWHASQNHKRRENFGASL